MENVQQTTGASRLDLLDAFDRGAVREALAAVDCEPELPGNLDDTLLRAEIALYRDRFDDAKALLERVKGIDLWLDDEGAEGRRARRSRLIGVEIACFNGALADAERLVRPLVEAAVRVGDTQSELRALYDIARIARHRANWNLAIDRLDRALDLARHIGNRCYEGRVSYMLGFCWYKLDRFDAAIPHLQTARALLGDTENLRFRATVESFYGCLLADLGDANAALELLEHAEATVAQLGIVGDMVTARVNAARARLALGQYEQVEASLTDLLTWERTPEITHIELITLRLLAITQCVRGRPADARRSAEEAFRLAGVAGNDMDRLEARLLVARAKSLGGDEGARSDLEALVNEVDADGTPYLQAEARIYLARALLASDATEAKTICDAVRALPVLESFWWLRRELELVEAELRFMPVRITPDGQLVMDSRLGWPDLKAARETTERYWFERALAKTGGNVMAASRLLGLTRNEGHYLYHLAVKGVPARPSRAKNPDAPANAARRRPRTRG